MPHCRLASCFASSMSGLRHHAGVHDGEGDPGLPVVEHDAAHMQAVVDLRRLLLQEAARDDRGQLPRRNVDGRGAGSKRQAFLGCAEIQGSAGDQQREKKGQSLDHRQDTVCNRTLFTGRGDQSFVAPARTRFSQSRACRRSGMSRSNQRSLWFANGTVTKVKSPAMPVCVR